MPDVYVVPCRLLSGCKLCASTQPVAISPPAQKCAWVLSDRLNCLEVKNKNSFCRLIYFLWRSLAVSLSLSHSPHLSLSLSFLPTNALRCKDWWQYWGQGRTVTPSFRIPLDSTAEHSYSFDWAYLLCLGCPNFSWQRTTPLIVGRFAIRTWQNKKAWYTYLPNL